MPFPSSSNSLVVTFIRAPNSCEIDTRNSPWFLIQKLSKAFFHVFGLDEGSLGNGETPLDCPNEEIVLIESLLKASGSSSDASVVFAGFGDRYV